MTLTQTLPQPAPLIHLPIVFVAKRVWAVITSQEFKQVVQNDGEILHGLELQRHSLLQTGAEHVSLMRKCDKDGSHSG